LVGVITTSDSDFNNSDKLGKGKEMVDRLTNLIAIFEDDSLNFGGNSAEGDDLLGDAYEYLMKNFATQSGKSKGQFYTPAEVSRIMAKIIGINNETRQDQTIYDPTSGSGSLLLKAVSEAPRGLTIYGQEKDVSTVALAKMNMILHNNEMADIRQGDTITSPEFKNENGGLKTFDFAVANPPFSTKSWSNGINPLNDEYKRFDGFGVPPEKNGDYAFLLHLTKSLKSNGKGAIILPHGVLFRGNAEGVIRKNIIQKGYIKGIIGLPANLFYGTGIPAAIIVIDKENAAARTGIFMIDASKGFIKDGNKNRLREQDVIKIVDTFNYQLEIPKYSRMVSFSEIEDNEYNLNIPRYIDNQEEEDIQDIQAHLLGGIPETDITALQKYWDVCPNLKNDLFSNGDREGYYNLNVSKDNIKDAINNNEDFKTYSSNVNSIINDWVERHRNTLEDINSNTDSKLLIQELSEDILKSFEGKTLIEKYDIYQYLMTYWLETMKDDVYIIIENGWIGDRDLLPEEIVVNKYFLKEREEIDSLEADRDEIISKKEEFEEENSGDEGILEDYKNDKGSINKNSIKNRLKEIKDNSDFKDEFDALSEYIEIIDKEAAANKKIKEAVKALEKLVDEKYESLSTSEVKDLVINYKWIPAIIGEVNSELDKISHRLTSRIIELAERYDETLTEIKEEVESYSNKVEEHLKRMEFTW
jgi:type I restriction enzyme M protein